MVEIAIAPLWQNHLAVSKRKLVMLQTSFRVKDLVGTVAKSRSEWWIDATAATAWLQPADVVVLPYHRVYTAVHTPIPPIHPIAIPIPTISSSPSPSTFIPLSRSTPLPPGSEGVLVAPLSLSLHLSLSLFAP